MTSIIKESWIDVSLSTTFKEEFFELVPEKDLNSLFSELNTKLSKSLKKSPLVTGFIVSSK